MTASVPSPVNSTLSYRYHSAGHTRISSSIVDVKHYRYSYTHDYAIEVRCRINTGRMTLLYLGTPFWNHYPY